jgi:uncharacterized membrane protein YqjE
MDPDERSTVGLVSDVLQHLSNLVRGEIALARSEVEKKVKQVARGLVMVVVAAIFGLITLGLVATAAVLGLVEAGLSPLVATVITAAVFAVMALIAGLIGKRSIAPSGLAPDRSVRNLKRDAHTLKEVFQHEHAH